MTGSHVMADSGLSVALRDDVGGVGERRGEGLEGLRAVRDEVIASNRLSLYGTVRTTATCGLVNPGSVTRALRMSPTDAPI